MGLPPGQAVGVVSQVCKMVWGCHLAGLYVLCHRCARWCGAATWPGCKCCAYRCTNWCGAAIWSVCRCCVTGVRDGVGLPSGRSVGVVSQVCEMVWGCHLAGLCVLCHMCARWCGAATWPGCRCCAYRCTNLCGAAIWPVCWCCVTGVRDGVGLPPGRAVCVVSQVCEMVWGCHLAGL